VECKGRDLRKANSSLRALRVVRVLAVAALVVTFACAPAVKRLGGAPTAAQMAEFWIDPGTTPRDLFAGPGGSRYKHPPSDVPYDIDSYDTSGFSITYKVRDAQRNQRNVKVGPEALKDLGASLGETGRMDPRRGYIGGFEREPLITGVEKGRVRFGFRGRHQELLDGIRVEDVQWICQRLKRITDCKWPDAFRAGNYTSDVAARYVARTREKIDEGLRLP
jgi:hypothetical protein